jgi:hypothetical protein
MSRAPVAVSVHIRLCSHTTRSCARLQVDGGWSSVQCVAGTYDGGVHVWRVCDGALIDHVQTANVSPLQP